MNPYLARYINHSRQELIEQWDQSQVSESTLLVVGANRMGELISIGTSAIGSNVAMLPSEQGDALIFAQSADVFSIKETVEGLFAECYVEAFGVWLPGVERLFQGNIKAAVVCSGDKGIIERAMEVTQSLEIPLMVLISTHDGFQLWIDPEKPPEQTSDRKEMDLGTAFVAAGLVINEYRRYICPLEEDCPPEPVIQYNRLESLSRPTPSDMVMIGAGGIGGPLGISLAPLARNLHIYDGDTGEASNRSRNPWIIEDYPKASALANFIEDAFDRVSCVSHDQYLEGADEDLPSCDVIIATPDNWAARAICYEIAISRGIPFVNGGCSVSGAVSYISSGGGGPACLMCRKPDLNELILSESARSCSLTPSVLPPNWIAAGLVNALVENVLLSDRIDAFSGTLVYDTGDPRRFSRRPGLRCQC